MLQNVFLIDFTSSNLVLIHKMISTRPYSYKPWGSNDIPDPKELADPSWKGVLNDIPEKIINVIHNETKEGIVIFPYPKLIFKAFELPLSEVQIVIIGQDPYFNMSFSGPLAMGMSFSIPLRMEIPSSLQNIYKNLVKFKHLRTIPSHGNLEKIASQGVLFMNAALTVQQGKAKSHKKLWMSYTDEIIKKIDSSTIVFVLWGSDAIEKAKLITKGTIIASSHPSGLSATKSCGPYPAFMDNDFAKDLGVDWNVLLP